eukprot:GHRQ01025988.1.p3 GENE.GHRQ01025988.1~~GHRQ01025988.1.p3  ORF type:complete len:117 (+),score=29.65 GHRQ01025988.1:242-592(+)
MPLLDLPPRLNSRAITQHRQLLLLLCWRQGRGTHAQCPDSLSCCSSHHAVTAATTILPPEGNSGLAIASSYVCLTHCCAVLRTRPVLQDSAPCFGGKQGSCVRCVAPAAAVQHKRC